MTVNEDTNQIHTFALNVLKIYMVLSLKQRNCIEIKNNDLSLYNLCVYQNFNTLKTDKHFYYEIFLYLNSYNFIKNILHFSISIFINTLIHYSFSFHYLLIIFG